jgi:hypothetical protein
VVPYHCRNFISIPLTGGCGIVSAVGTIIVNNTGQITLVKQISHSNVNNGTINATLSGGLSSVQYIKLTQKYNMATSARNSGFTNRLGTNVAFLQMARYRQQHPSK